MTSECEMSGGFQEIEAGAEASIRRQITFGWRVGVTGSERLRPQVHHQPRLPAISSHRKNGAPTVAVRMPSGTSISAMERASMSTTSR